MPDANVDTAAEISAVSDQAMENNHAEGAGDKLREDAYMVELCTDLCTSTCESESIKQDEKTEIDRKEMEEAADALEYALNGGIGIGCDKDTIKAVFDEKTREERESIKRIWDRKYGSKYGHNLETELKSEMGGIDLEESLAAVQSHYKEDFAGTMRVALVDLRSNSGRSAGKCEDVLRSTLEVMNSDDIARADAEYRRRYGIGLKEAVMKDPNVSDDSRVVLAIYFKGCDKRTDTDTLKLARHALQSQNLEMFKEVFRGASDGVRKQFLNSGGEQKICEAFGYVGNPVLLGSVSTGIYEYSRRTSSARDVAYAMDYAKYGKLGLDTIVNANNGIWDNEVSVEKSTEELKVEERRAYVNGRKLFMGEQVPGLSYEERKQALDYYNCVNKALRQMGNETEVEKWEDMIENKGGTLVSKIANHNGVIDDLNGVLKTIEDMDGKDWERIRTDMEYRQKVFHVLGTFLSPHEVDRCKELISKKIAKESFDEARTAARRPLMDTIRDNCYWYDYKEGAIYEAIENMTPAEQEEYRTNHNGYRDELDELLKDKLGNSEEAVAFALLKKVSNGEAPDSDILVKLLKQATNWDASEADVVADVEEALKEPDVSGFSEKEKAVYRQGEQLYIARRNPEDNSLSREEKIALEFYRRHNLRKILAEPQVHDLDYARKFERLGCMAIGSGDYDRYIAPIVKIGRLPLATKTELYRGCTDNNEFAMLQAVADAGREEQRRLVSDMNYRDIVLHGLTDEEKEIALNVAAQGKWMPEDKLRAHMLGAGTSEAEIREVLSEVIDLEQFDGKDLTDEQKRAVIGEKLKGIHRRYALKYDDDLSARFVDEMEGVDLLKVQSMENQRSSKSDFLRTQDQVSRSTDGAGARFVTRVLDGTPDQLLDIQHQFAAAVAEHSAKFQELPLEVQSDYIERINEGVKALVESKGTAADAIVDTVMAAAGLGGAIFTGGLSLGLVSGCFLAGSVFKVGAKAAIAGADYNAAMAYVDGLTGGVDGALTFAGGAELSQLLKLGEKIGLKTSASAFRALTKIDGLVLKEGAESLLQKGVKSLVSRSIGEGCEMVSDKAIQAAVRMVVVGDEQAEAAFRILKKELQAAIKVESEHFLRNQVTRYGLIAASAAAGGASSGGIRGLAEWDQSLSVKDNLGRTAYSAGLSGLLATGGGIVFTTLFDAGRKVLSGFGSGVDHLADGVHTSANNAAEAADDIDITDARKVVKGEKVGSKASDTPEGASKSLEIPVLAALDEDLSKVFEEIRRMQVEAGIDNLDPSIDVTQTELLPELKIEGAPAQGSAAELGDYRSRQIKTEAQIRETLRSRRGSTGGTSVGDLRLSAEDSGPIAKRTGKLSTAERTAMGAEARIGIASDDVINQFHGLVEPVLGSWTRDLAPKLHQLRVLSDELVESMKSLRQRLVKAGLVKEGSFHKSDMVKEILGQSPHGQKYTDDYNRYLKLRSEFALEGKAFLEELDERVADLQSALDKFVSSEKVGIPDARIKVFEDLSAIGAAYRDGIVYLRKSDLLNQGNIGTLKNHLYEEVAHSQQDSLMIRQLADEIGIKDHPTDQQFDKLKREYIGRVRSAGDQAPPPDEYVRKALENRGGKRLTHDESQLALELMESWRQNGPVVRALKQNGNYRRRTAEYLKDLNRLDEEEVSRLLEGLENRSIRRSSLGPEAKSPSEWAKMNGFESIDSLDAAGQVKLLEDYLNDHLAHLRQSYRETIRKYNDFFHERSAKAAAALMSDMDKSSGAVTRGLTNGDSRAAVQLRRGVEKLGLVDELQAARSLDRILGDRVVASWDNLEHFGVSPQRFDNPYNPMDRLDTCVAAQSAAMLNTYGTPEQRLIFIEEAMQKGERELVNAGLGKGRRDLDMTHADLFSIDDNGDPMVTSEQVMAMFGDCTDGSPNTVGSSGVNSAAKSLEIAQKTLDWLSEFGDDLEVENLDRIALPVFLEDRAHAVTLFIDRKGRLKVFDPQANCVIENVPGLDIRITGNSAQDVSLSGLKQQTIVPEFVELDAFLRGQADS